MTLFFPTLSGGAGETYTSRPYKIRVTNFDSELCLPWSPIHGDSHTLDLGCWKHQPTAKPKLISSYLYPHLTRWRPWYLLIIYGTEISVEHDLGIDSCKMIIVCYYWWSNAESCWASWTRARLGFTAVKKNNTNCGIVYSFLKGNSDVIETPYVRESCFGFHYSWFGLLLNTPTSRNQTPEVSNRSLQRLCSSAGSWEDLRCKTRTASEWIKRQVVQPMLSCLCVAAHRLTLGQNLCSLGRIQLHDLINVASCRICSMLKLKGNGDLRQSCTAPMEYQTLESKK